MHLVGICSNFGSFLVCLNHFHTNMVLSCHLCAFFYLGIITLRGGFEIIFYKSSVLLAIYDMILSEIISKLQGGMKVYILTGYSFG